jgi:hypothetical protein
MYKPKRGPRPHIWCSGPDPLRHKQYQVWLQQKNQAQFRKEGWQLDFEPWLDMWRDLWPQRGRATDEYCMTRVDTDLPWSKDNVMIITRKEHGRIQGLRRMGQNNV